MMRIFDRNDTELEVFDETKGYLIEDRLLVNHHEAIVEVPEEGHWETLVEYPNGGKDVEWVVDVPGVKAQDAWDEYEDILRFIPFTELELVTNRIAELKQLLQNTDYNILKIVEGASTLAECAEVIAKRASWRKEINELEFKMNNL
jgi:hypothetical protein